MNVIIANQYKDALSNLNIDVIKRMDGEFEVSTIVDTFANFYFNRMIIDITALKDCYNINTIQRLSTSLDASKIILFLNDDPRISNPFLSKVISLGIYNFTRDLTGVEYLMENPNSYRDVAQYHDLAATEEKNLSQPQNNYNNNFNGGFNQNNGMNMGPDMPQAPQNNGGFFGGFGGNNNNYSNNNYNTGTPVIGFKDLTSDAGATTLIYMLKKQIQKSHKVLAIEVNANNFSYFNDGELMSITMDQFASVRNKFSQFEVVLIDINNSNLDMDGTCTDVIYLLEPSTIKLNTLIRRDRQALEKIKDRKIVLNKSLLSVSDVKEFEYEAKVKMFYNIPPLDERKDSQMVLDSFLQKLGIFNPNAGFGVSSIFDMFKKNN